MDRQELEKYVSDNFFIERTDLGWKASVSYDRKIFFDLSERSKLDNGVLKRVVSVLVKRIELYERLKVEEEECLYCDKKWIW